MALTKILIGGLILSSLLVTGVVGLFTPTGHEAADTLFGNDHHDEEYCSEHHHFYELGHHNHHHHEDHDHDDCDNEYENENQPVIR